MQSNFQVVIPQTSAVDSGKNVLYLSDLPHNVLESDLFMFFEDFKDKIVVMNINAGSKHYDSFGQKSLSAKIIFKDFKSADEARRSKNMNKIKGKTVRVMWDERDNSLRYSSGANIFVKNIPFEVKPREFYELFLSFGDISSSKLPEDENGHLGYGYINYYDAESANKAIAATDGKEIWGSKLDVKYFQKKNERHGVYPSSNSSVYIKNLPLNYSEKDLKSLCQPFGEILNAKISQDDFGRISAIVSFVQEESSHKAKNGINGMKIQDQELFADFLMNKQERKKVLSSKIMDTNYKLNEQYKLCNLHIRNIPYHAKEEDLTEAFKKFGEIKSVKIEKYMLVTKENNELKQYPTSKGFGYVCFEDSECAKKALEEMNEKFLPKFETWKRPLIIEYFMPKGERTPIVVNKINQTNSFTNPQLPFMNMNMFTPNFMPPYKKGGVQGPHFGQMPNMPMNMPMYPPQQRAPYNPNYKKKPYVPAQPQPQFAQPQFAQPQVPKQTQPIEKDELDYNYLNSLDYESKKDYLGEFIFKRIENHKLAQSNNLTIDLIGKITGMILGIEDIQEIVDIYRNTDNLTSRISEALELISTKN
jgi:polyadenylate-binding protein